MNKQKERQQGQSLVEVLIAFTVMVLAVVGLVSMTVSSLNSTNFAKNQSFATTQAQEAMEAIRNSYYTQNWANFQSNCQTTGESKLADLNNEVAGKYSAAVVCAADGNGQKVTINITWSETDKQHQSVLEDYFAQK